jgi:hypothetical protein
MATQTQREYWRADPFEIIIAYPELHCLANWVNRAAHQHNLN